MNDSIHGGLRVCQSTPLVQLQDRGRFGCRHLGVTQGGALDWLSMGWANWLLGNPLDAAVIEIALGGFVAECRADGWLALAGGDHAAEHGLVHFVGLQARPLHRGAHRRGAEGSGVDVLEVAEEAAHRGADGADDDDRIFAGHGIFLLY